MVTTINHISFTKITFKYVFCLIEMSDLSLLSLTSFEILGPGLTLY